MTSTLVNRNVTVSGRRTSMRLEPELWDALAEIAGHEGRTINEICTQVDRRRRESTLTAAIRVFIVAYFRARAHQSEADDTIEPVARELTTDPRPAGGNGLRSKGSKHGGLGSTPVAL
ncbi:MAG: ribbon-helix-helix domain-containing protein [Alphaproteobacteria bacterium]